MADNLRILNLDEVFGQDRPVKVLWGGREYELLRLEAFSPRQIHALGKLQGAAARLSEGGMQNAEGSDAEIEALFDEMLAVLCKELPLATMPFLAKTRIITFYIEETQGKKALEEALMKPPIGATS
jgi:hypothetical protein